MVSCFLEIIIDLSYLPRLAFCRETVWGATDTLVIHSSHKLEKSRRTIPSLRPGLREAKLQSKSGGQHWLQTEIEKDRLYLLTGLLNMSLLDEAATPFGTSVFALSAGTPSTVKGPMEAPFADIASTAAGGDMTSSHSEQLIVLNYI